MCRVSAPHTYCHTHTHTQTTHTHTHTHYYLVGVPIRPKGAYDHSLEDLFPPSLEVYYTKQYSSVYIIDTKASVRQQAALPISLLGYVEVCELTDIL